MTHAHRRIAALLFLAALAPLGCRAGVVELATSQPAPTLEAALSAGSGHATAVAKDGSVWVWGNNDEGELGLEGGARHAPARLPVAEGRAASAGESGTTLEYGSHTLVLTRAGTVLAFGDNDHGQLGLASLEDRHAPVALDGLADVIDLSAGSDFSVAVRADGTAWAWGRNAFGQLGSGEASEADRTRPVAVATVKDFKAVSAGRYHTLGLRADGRVVAWGDNTVGQLGDGSFETRRAPVSVRNLTEVVQVAAGDEFSLALRRNGTVWVWGDNDDGQLAHSAYSRTQEANEPLPVAGLADVVAIAAGADHALALRRDGTVWAWGCNDFGQLGNGQGGFGRFVAVPQRVAGLEGVALIAAGASYSLAAKADGTVWAWGTNANGELGQGAADLDSHPLPIAVRGPEGQGQLKLVP